MARFEQDLLRLTIQTPETPLGQRRPIQTPTDNHPRIVPEQSHDLELRSENHQRRYAALKDQKMVCPRDLACSQDERQRGTISPRSVGEDAVSVADPLRYAVR
jgi:hypothetical protein